jgi:protein gp37
MSTQSRIEWTEHTWNPVVGCTKVSPGCKHCYAEVMARRLRAMGASGYEDGFKLRLRPEKLDDPLRRRKPTIYFVNSMSDLFHPKVPGKFVESVFQVMTAANWHVFQLLTKRPDRMAAFLQKRRIADHIWVGTSVENRRHGVPRIDRLREVNAAVRFLSVEPLLENVGKIDLRGIAWVIVGGESGPRARPMEPDWARSVHQQCIDAGTRFFFKQWGTHGPDGIRRTKKSNGRIFEGKVWSEMPQFGSAAGARSWV